MNKSGSSPIVRNIFSITTGHAISLIFNFLSFTLAARYLGVESFGKFSYLLALVVAISKLIDFGFTPIVFRELAKHKDSFSLLNTALLFRGLLFFIILGLLNIILLIFSFSNLEVILANILFFNTIISTKFINIRELLDLPFKVKFEMHYPMLIAFIDNFIFLAFVLAMPYLKGDIYYFITAYVISNIPGFVLILVILKKRYSFKLNFRFDNTKWLVVTSLPIFGFILLDIIYQQMELFFLNYYHGYYDVGIYSAGLRLVMPLLIFPSAIIHTVFPILTSNPDGAEKKNEIIINLVFKILYFFAVIIAVCAAFKSDSIIPLLLGNEYLKTGPPVVLLLIAQIFVYYNFFCTNLTVVYNKQLWNVYLMLFLLTGNLILNIVLIPIYSFIGAGLSKLIISSAGTIITTLLINRLGYKLYFFKMKQVLWTTLLVASTYGLSYLNLFPFVAIYLVTVFCLTLVTRFYSKEEISYFLRLMGKGSWANKLNSILS